MEKQPFDKQEAHKFFSAQCFNKAWDLIDTPVRTPEEDSMMLALSMASLWHWTQRTDCTNENLSVAYWQISRIFAILGQENNSREYGELCLKVSQDPDLPPFCLGYAYEALARAESSAGNWKKVKEYIQLARGISTKMKDPDTKKQLISDLSTIRLE